MNNTFPPDHPLSHLVRSDTPESIYYADLFLINNHNWMIQGYGKTTAARIASNKKSEAMYATDSVAIIRSGDTLFGRYDPGALSTKNPKLHELHKLDAIAYCLSEEETIKVFKPRGGGREIIDVGPDILAAICATYPYPAYCAQHFFVEHELLYFADPLRMTKRFIELTQGVSGTKFLIIPHMPTIEEKAALYSSFNFE